MLDDRHAGDFDDGPGDLSPGAVHELSAALHQLAQDHQSAPLVRGAEIRRRAVQRGRRRAAGAGAAMVLAVGVLTNLGHEPGHRSTPAASRRHGPVTTATVAPFAAEATVDLTTRTLRVAGRVLPVSSGVPEWPTPMGRMTVVAKYEVTELPTDALHPDGKSEIKLPWVIELRTPGQGRNYIVPVTWAPKAPGNYSATGGWIGVRTSDAHWLYTQLHEGSVLVVMGEPPATQAPEIAPTA